MAGSRSRNSSGSGNGVSANASAKAEVNARATAIVAGSMWSLTQSELIICGALTVTTCVSVFVHGATKDALSPWVAGASLFLIGSVIANRIARSWRIHESPAPFTVSADEEGRITYSGYSLNPSEFVLQLRGAVLNRGPVPIPDGEVVNGDPAKEENVKPFTEDQRRELATSLPGQVIASDIEVLRQALSPSEPLTEGQMGVPQKLPAPGAGNA